jgi:Holliday junction resolvase RusA-like endonuclease
MLTEKSKLNFQLVGEPVGKARPRFSAGRVYTPTKTADYERRLSTAAWQQMVVSNLTVTDKPVSVQIVMEAPIPKSWSKLDKKIAALGGRAPSKPDVDNVLKIILDACNGIVYRDDAQVVHVDIRKRYGAEASPGCVYVSMGWE